MAAIQQINCHGYKNNYLKRLFVGEWLYILSQIIKLNWLQLEAKNII